MQGFLTFFQQNEICISINYKRRNLRLAFSFISEKLDDDEEVLKFSTWQYLLKELFPKYSKEKVEFLWQSLRRENNEKNKKENYISKHQVACNLSIIEQDYAFYLNTSCFFPGTGMSLPFQLSVPL